MQNRRRRFRRIRSDAIRLSSTYKEVSVRRRLSRRACGAQTPPIFELSATMFTYRSRLSGVRRFGALVAAALLGGAGQAAAQDAHPFKPGERMTYDVRFSAVKVGSGSMEVRDITEVRGQPAYHTVFRVKGGTLFYRVNDVFESWLSVDDLSSLRFHKDQDEGPREKKTRFEIYPERQAFHETTKNKGEQPSVEAPLDEGSFLYLVRTVPL